MVYTGRPSQGCHNCRARKIRCDRLPNGCTQCSSTRRQCPGYREQSNYLFRSENERTVKNYRARKVKASASASDSESPRSSSRYNTTGSHPTLVLRAGNPNFSSQLPLLLPRQVTTTIEEQATAFFVSKLVLGASIGASEGFFERIGQIDYEKSDHLLASMKAVGLNGLAGAFRDPMLQIDARKQYFMAVRLTKSALRSAEEVKNDSTLLAVMCLSLFERYSGDNNDAYINSGTHMNGAAAVIKVRGREQMRTHQGLRMFVQVAAALMSYCWQEDLHMPAVILELAKEETFQMMVTQESSFQILYSSMAFTEFNASVKDGTISDPAYIIQRALMIQREFDQIFTMAPSSWTYQIFQAADTDPLAVYRGCYHVYTNFWTARMWNVSRLAKLSLHSTIRDTLSKSNTTNFSIWSEQFLESTETMVQMQEEILFSVPEHIGFSSGPIRSTSRTTTPDSQSSSTSSSRQVSPQREKNFSWPDPRTKGIVGGNYILYPLYKAGTVNLSPRTLQAKLWSIQRLRYLGHVIGLQQGLNHATLLEKTLT